MKETSKQRFIIKKTPRGIAAGCCCLFIKKGKVAKALIFLTFLQICLKSQDNYSIMFKTIKSSRIQETVI